MKSMRIVFLLAVLISLVPARAQNASSATSAAASHLSQRLLPPGSVFRDCSSCPAMVVIPAGDFTMGSSAPEKSWAASHGGNLESVADEAPQHRVSLRSFALGKYDVTRHEYAAFVKETGYAAADECYDSSMPNSAKRAGASWQNPGFTQTEHDPVVCVSWQDARAYASWLNEKLRREVTSSRVGNYRLPSESEWE